MLFDIIKNIARYMLESLLQSDNPSIYSLVFIRMFFNW